MTINGAHTFMTSGDIMEWMVDHNSRINDQMQTAMDGAENRADIAHALANLKDQLQQSKGAQSCYGARAQAVNDFLAQYGDDPVYGPQLTKDLKPIADGYTDGQATWDATEDADSGQVGMYADTIDGYITTVQGDIDQLNKDDQLSLIRINDDSSRINQGEQLASNLISQMNQTAMSIINNIK